MLLQSHENYIAPLASIPDEWTEGSFKGLVARGGFEVDAIWKDGCAVEFIIHSKAGNRCCMKYKGISKATFDFDAISIDEDRIEFETNVGETYHITEVPAWEKLPYPESLKAAQDRTLTWDYTEPVKIWRAIDSAPAYELIESEVAGGTYRDCSFDFDKAETVTYKITRTDALSAAENGAFATVNHSTKLERERYRYLLEVLNMYCGGVDLENI